ncbi:retrovirus-related pol polyprotein from transposon RE2 [Tanacetum coccineum]
MLKCFFLASGLQINILKSQLMGIGVSNEELLAAANIIGCSTFSTPFSYLGVKVGMSPSRRKAWDEIICKQWELHQMDVKNAFLHHDLEEEMFMKLPPALKNYGFVQSYSDYSLFTIRHNEVQVNFLDLGNLKYFLGVEVARAQDWIFLCQRKYALDIICKAGLLGAKPAKIPMEQNHRLRLAKGRLFENPKQYQRLFMQNPQIEHWVPTIRVVWFLKGSPRQGDSPVSWKIKKQYSVSRSSAETKYWSMALTIGELKWLKGILNSLGTYHPQPMLLFCDSLTALHIYRNPVFHERTKHIKVDCYYIRDEIVYGNLDARHVPTKTKLPDIFT